jgi:hypothetical protein
MPEKAVDTASLPDGVYFNGFSCFKTGQSGQL